MTAKADATDRPAPPREAELYAVYVLPFAVFLAFTLLLQFGGAAIRWEHPSAAWWQRAPEQLIYPLQTLVAGWCVWRVRRRVAWNMSLRYAIQGTAFGVIGIAIWLIPAFCTLFFPECALAHPDLRTTGFDPAEAFGSEHGGLIACCYALRIVRAVVVVACVEELFWRGFLMRFLIDRDHPQRVAIGTPSLLSWGGTTLCFMLIHPPQDYPAAFVYGTLAWWLTVRTKSIGATVTMHAVANLILAWTALGMGLKGLW